MTRFDLPHAAAALPGHWLTAALPDAQLCQLSDAALSSLTSADDYEISGLVRAAMTSSCDAGATFVIVDESSAYWRLRRPPAARSDLWLLQSLADSRRIILQGLRTVFAARLANSSVHELRNPLNALGLQCDLLGRMLKPTSNADTLTQAAGRVSQMRDRLRDLLERQNSMVSLWLSEPGESATLSIAAMLDETLRLLRSYASQHEVRVQAENMSAFESVAASRASVEVRMVLLVIGVLAVDSSTAAARAGRDANVLLEALPGIGNIAATLQIKADLSAAALPAELRFGDSNDWRATLALLLDDQAIEVRFIAEGGAQLRVLLR